MLIDWGSDERNSSQAVANPALTPTPEPKGGARYGKNRTSGASLPCADDPNERLPSWNRGNGGSESWPIVCSLRVKAMNKIIYIVGLVVVVIAVLSFFGLR